MATEMVDTTHSGPPVTRNGFTRTYVIDGYDTPRKGLCHVGEYWICDACWKFESEGHAPDCTLMASAKVED